MNIVDPVLFQGATQPKSAALCAPGTGIDLISYGRLVQMIRNICRQLTKLGFGLGKTAAVAIKDPIFMSAVTLALARLGAVSVSRYDERILNTIKVDALITDVHPQSAKIDQVILADLTWTRGGDGFLELNETCPTTPDDLCRIILTSGTTGDPKATAFTHRMVADRIALNNIAFGSRLPDCSRIYSDLPISTASGFRFLLYTLWRGGTFFFPGETFESTVDAFDKYKVQCVLASPGGAEVMLRKYEQYPSLQSEFEVMIVLGDMFSKALADRVCARICSNVVTVYGATETPTTASAPVQLIRDIPGAVGFVAPGATVEIVSDSGETLPRGIEGLIRIKSAYAVDHYLGDPEASAKTFRNGWFYPGDRGILEATNLLRITGRHDTLLNLGGDKINPETVERALATCPGIVECAAFGALDELGVVTLWVAVVASLETDEDTLRAHCKKALPPQFVPAGFVRVAKLPRNSMGKVDRTQLPKLLKY